MKRPPPPLIYNPAVPRERLTKAIEQARAPHLVPIYQAVRDFGCAHAVIGQRSGPIEVPEGLGDRPVILVIGDDFSVSLGPSGFDRRSLKKHVSSCILAAVVSGVPEVDVYASVAMTAALNQRNVLLVETRLQHETAWLCALRKMKPDMQILLSSVAVAGRA